MVTMETLSHGFIRVVGWQQCGVYHKWDRFLPHQRADEDRDTSKHSLTRSSPAPTVTQDQARVGVVLAPAA